MDAVSLKLARNYTNEKLNSLPSNRPTKTVSFDGGIYSVGNDVVNGQVSDVVIKGQTVTNLVKNGNFANGINSWAKSNCEISASNNVLTLVTSTTGGESYFYQDLGSIKAGTTIFFSCWARSLQEDKKIVVQLYDGINYIQSPILNIPMTSNWQRYSFKYTFNNDVSYPRIRIRYGISDTSCNFEHKELFGLILASDEIALSLEQLNAKYPYWFDGTKSTNSVRLRSVGKNLFDGEFDTKTGLKINYVTQNKISIGYRSAVGTNVDNILPKMKFEANTRYAFSGKIYETISGVNVRPRILYTDGTAEDVRFATTTPTEFVKVSASGKSILHITWGFSIGNAAGETIIENFKIEKGTVATPYEPYKESIVNVNLPEPLCSLPNGVKDEVSVSDGKLIKRVSDEVVLNGSEVWGYLDTVNGYARFYLSLSSRAPYLKQQGVVNFIAKIKNHNFENVGQTNYAAQLMDGNKITLRYSDSYIVTSIDVALLNEVDVNGFKNFLNSNPLTLIYQLAEPVVTKLPAQAPLQVFENGTVYVEPIGDPSETTLPSVEMTIPTGNSNKFGVASHDYDGAAADWVLTNSESKCFLLAVSNAGGAANIIAPDAPGVMYAISNTSEQTITIKISGGTGVEVTNAKTVLVIHNGTDYVALTAEL